MEDAVIIDYRLDFVIRQNIRHFNNRTSLLSIACPPTYYYTNINHFKSSEKKWLTDNSQLFLKLQYLFKAN